ncbi:MAG: peptidylprolyl isomerase, partial [Oligoflexia bacterium]
MTPRVIGFHYTLKNPAGEVLDSSSGQEPLLFLEGSGQIIPGLEEQLLLLSVGDKRTIQVPAGRAYGERENDLVMDVPKERLPKKDGFNVGDQFASRGPNGEPAGVFIVTAVAEETVTLDGNHPLAGVDLTFEVEIMTLRNATQEELSHGHAHGG